MASRAPQLSRRSFVAALAAAALASEPSRAAPAAARERAAALGQLNAILAAVDGETILAEAFRGGPLDRPANVKSVSKTLVATLTGAAIARGVLPGVEAPVLPYLAARAPRDLDPRAAEVTVEDLLTMRSGFARTSGGGYGPWVESDDWVGYILSRPMTAPPGARFAYSTGDYHLLSAVLTEAAGASLHALARDWLGRPLGVDVPPWTRDPQGYFMGGNEMALSPRAMLAFAEAIRTGAPEIAPARWIEASWRPRTRSPFSGHQYGYGWFLAEFGGARAAYARGYGGQMIYVFRDLPLSVAITSDPTLPARSQGHVGDLHRLVAEALAPLARRA
jgi:CubicO group peptidase (beta-lactamase class C family)